MEYFDLHCDTISECHDRGLPLRESPLQVTLAQAATFRPRAQVFAAWINDSLRGDAAWARFLALSDTLHNLLSGERAQTALCTTPAGLAGDRRSGRFSALFSIEGSAAFGGRLSNVHTARRLGVRMVGLTWNGSCEAADGCMVPGAGGLRQFGRALVRELERLRMVVDVSHLSDAGFADVARMARRPFVASHSNARAICPHPRNLTDAQFRAITERGGLVGLNFHRAFLHEGKEASADDVLRHADHFLRLGGERTLCLGSDFDGASPPPDLAGMRYMPALYARFVSAFGSELARRVFYDNAYAFFSRAL